LKCINFYTKKNKPMKYIVYKHKLFFIALSLFTLFVSVISYFVLPEKFFFDSQVIILDKYKEIGFIGSYPLTILFYKITLLKDLPFPIIALIQFPILIYILYKIGIPNNFHKITVKNLIVYLSFIMIAIFISMPSKEFITFLFVALLPFLFVRKEKTDRYKIIATILLFFSFSIYRTYYALIPVIAIGIFFLSYLKIKNKAISLVFYGVILSIFISLSVGFITGKNISEGTREKLNEVRLNDKNSNSIIVSPIETNTWYGEIIGISNGFIAVNLPLIEAIKHFSSPQILAFVIWQLFLLYILLIRFSKCLNNKENYKYEYWSLLLLFSYFIIQGIFEPDLGSAIRHKMGFFPLIYYILYYENFDRKSSKGI